MKVLFKESFFKSIKKSKNKSLKQNIRTIIEDVEKANKISEIKNITKLKGYKYYYRIRCGQYRIGIRINKNTVYFVVVADRKDIYKKFP